MDAAADAALSRAGKLVAETTPGWVADEVRINMTTTQEFREVVGELRVPVFHARGLTKVYRMGDVRVHALRGADLDLYAGEFLVLLGPSGSGKSTLLNILGGLDVPTAGTVRFQDHDLTAGDDDALTRYRRDHVGFIFQFYNLIPSLTA